MAPGPDDFGFSHLGAVDIQTNYKDTRLCQKEVEEARGGLVAYYRSALLLGRYEGYRDNTILFCIKHWQRGRLSVKIPLRFIHK